MCTYIYCLIQVPSHSSISKLCSNLVEFLLHCELIVLKHSWSVLYTALKVTKFIWCPWKYFLFCLRFLALSVVTIQSPQLTSYFFAFIVEIFCYRSVSAAFWRINCYIITVMTVFKVIWHCIIAWCFSVLQVLSNFASLMFLEKGPYAFLFLNSVSHYAFHFAFWATVINENGEEDTSWSFQRNWDCHCFNGISLFLLVPSVPPIFMYMAQKRLLSLPSYPLPGLIQLHFHFLPTFPVFADILPSFPSFCPYTPAFLVDSSSF